MPTLFDPIRLGGLDLPNRILMAPLTRMRADPATRAPTALVAEQYAQRASAGLIFAEATSVVPTQASVRSAQPPPVKAQF